MRVVGEFQVVANQMAGARIGGEELVAVIQIRGPQVGAKDTDEATLPENVGGSENGPIRIAARCQEQQPDSRRSFGGQSPGLAAIDNGCLSRIGNGGDTWPYDS